MGREAVDTTTEALTVMVYVRDVELPLASDRNTVNEEVPVKAGVAVSTPVKGFNVKPDGKLGADQLYGTVPPVPEIVVEYANPETAFGTVVVVISSTLLITIVNVFEVLAPERSVTETSKVLLPFDVGVPVIVPVPLLKARPGGNDPLSDQVMGRVPPDMTRVWLYA